MIRPLILKQWRQKQALLAEGFLLLSGEIPPDGDPLSFAGTPILAAADKPPAALLITPGARPLAYKAGKLRDDGKIVGQGTAAKEERYHFVVTF